MADLRYEDRFWNKWYKMLGLPEELPESESSFIESIYNLWAERLPGDRVAWVCGGYRY